MFHKKDDSDIYKSINKERNILIQSELVRLMKARKLESTQ